MEYVGFPQSALNGTEVEIRLNCADSSDLQFDVQFVLRSSPCDKEFFDASRQAQVKDLLVRYCVSIVSQRLIAKIATAILRSYLKYIYEFLD